MKCARENLLQALFLVVAGMSAAALAGCESDAVRQEATPAFFVPTSSISQPSGRHAVASIRPEQVLPGSEAAMFYAPRSEPVAYGMTVLGGISAFTDYTYDAQPISTLNGSGTHYRYVVKQGISAP